MIKPSEDEIIAKYASLRRQDRMYLPTWRNLTDHQRIVAKSEITTLLRTECRAAGVIFAARHQDGRRVRNKG